MGDFDDFDGFGDFDIDMNEFGADSENTGSSAVQERASYGEEFDVDDVEKKDKFEISPIKLIIAGVIIIVLIVIVMGIVKKVEAVKENKESTSTKSESTEVVKERESQEVNMREEVAPTSTVGYLEITGDDPVEFSNTMTELVYTVTGVKHYASKQGDIVVLKTQLQGSLSGLAGIYNSSVQ